MKQELVKSGTAVMLTLKGSVHAVLPEPNEQFSLLVQGHWIFVRYQAKEPQKKKKMQQN